MHEKSLRLQKYPPKCVLKTKGTSPDINLAPFQGCRVYLVSSTIQQKNQTAAFLQEGPALHTTERSTADPRAFFEFVLCHHFFECNSLCSAEVECKTIFSFVGFIIKNVCFFLKRTCLHDYEIKSSRTVESEA